MRSNHSRYFPTSLLLVFLFPLMIVTIRGQDTDSEPPTLVKVSFNPTAVDVSHSPARVLVTVEATDNLSGVARLEIAFVSPRATIVRAEAIHLGENTYSAEITIPRYAASGDWLLRVTVRDSVGNQAIFTSEYFQPTSLPYRLTVVSQPADNDPPIPTSILFSPASVAVSNQEAQVALQIGIGDALSGVHVDPDYFDSFSLIVSSPSGQQVRLFNNDFIVAGTPHDTTLTAIVSVPQYAEGGAWRVSLLRVVDFAGNIRTYSRSDLIALGVDTTLLVYSDPADVQPPTLEAISFSPLLINTSLGGRDVVVDLHLRDDLSGVSFGSRTFWNRLFITSPSRQQQVAAYRDDFRLVHGNNKDGVWRATLRFPQYSEAGTWNTTFLRIEDSVFNLRFLNATSLLASGFRTDVTVIRPSLSIDGHLGINGGTVEDATFGSRASLTVPPGILTGDSSIAIDVLDSPIAVPLPLGFEATGTLFVNIKIDPQPLYPVAPPGFTVVLPLTVPQPSGLALALYRIDPATGILVPALDFEGKPAIGYVDDTGMKATFAGILSFSTVTGLLPDPQSVTVDFRPDNPTNSISLNSAGLVQTGILSGPEFDASIIDLSSVTVAGAPTESASLRDLNRDGLPDMVVSTRVSLMMVSPRDEEVIVSGRTLSGRRFVGVDKLRVVPSQ